jgi:hypothetical protein
MIVNMIIKSQQQNQISPFKKMKTITSLASLIAIGSSLFAKSASADQHFVDFYEIYNVISLTGQMEVPTKDLSGTPYLWPGLQPYNNQGVLQPVLGKYDITVENDDL